MIEKIVYDFLTEKMSVPVYMEVPKNPPTRMVIVEKTGSSLDVHIHINICNSVIWKIAPGCSRAQ
jgi:hypothetical protein